jgi:thiol-disulfide isomerase/thioredoxin
MAPNLSVAGESVLLSWLEPFENKEGKAHALKFSRLADGKWSEPRTIVARAGFFANWADFPSVVETTNGVLFAHWLEKSGSSTYAYDVRIARSADGGSTWEELGPVHDDGTQTEHGFVSFVPEGDGMRAFWLDGRETADSAGNEHGGEGGHAGSMTLRTAFIGEVPGPSELLDGRVCDCCQTSAALTDQGPVVIYRDRSEEEIRDISVVRQVDGSWQPPVSLHDDGWEVPGCPVNGPALDAAGSNLLAAWHTVPEGEARVMAAFSDDSGATFSDPVIIDGNKPLGRVDAILINDSEAVVSWLAQGAESAGITLRKVTRAGVMGLPLRLSSTSENRASGFPRMVLTGDAIVVVWTHAGDPSTLRAAVMSIDALPEAASKDEESHDVASLPEGRPWDGELGSLMPDAELSDLGGAKVAFSSFKGSAVLINLWATWCGPCVTEIPELIALHEEYEKAGLKVIGLSLDDSDAREAVQAMVKETAMSYRVLHDQAGRGSEIFEVMALPSSFLFDREGKLVWQLTGVVQKDDAVLNQKIRKALSSS